MAKYLVVLCCLFVAGALAGVPNRRIPTPRIDPHLNWRIVGGSDAPAGRYIHQISLRYFGSHSCGGSIVAKNWVITAAHCVARDSPSYLTVVAGSTTLNSGGVSVAVQKIHYHENYDSWNIQNDVAILQTDDIEYGDNVGPIAAESEDVAGDVDVILSGWGTTSYPGSIPNNLQHINLKTTTVDYCKSRHSTPVIESEICTLTKAGEGACHGDSGGPLIRVADGEDKLVGIVSWGRPCAVGYPDVFSRVSSFRSWFNDKCDNCV